MYLTTFRAGWWFSDESRLGSKHRDPAERGYLKKRTPGAATRYTNLGTDCRWRYDNQC